MALTKTEDPSTKQTTTIAIKLFVMTWIVMLSVWERSMEKKRNHYNNCE